MATQASCATAPGALRVTRHALQHQGFGQVDRVEDFGPRLLAGLAAAHVVQRQQQLQGPALAVCQAQQRGALHGHEVGLRVDAAGAVAAALAAHALRPWWMAGTTRCA
jgi:hypothetical protein